MNHTELQALRRLLFFSVSEAALLVAASPERPQGVSERAWQWWERGERAVPTDVAMRVRELCGWRRHALTAARDQIEAMMRAHGAGELALVWYGSLDDWASLPGREPVTWRPQCSVLATLSGEYSHARLVLFDAPAYARWLAGRDDSETMRGQWAAETAQDA